MDAGTIGGIAGSVLGVLGGVLGSYFSIKNTRSPKERAFAIKATAIVWLFVITFICGLLWLPQPYNFLMWVPYALFLPSFIKYWNKHQQLIRAEVESENT